MKRSSVNPYITSMQRYCPFTGVLPNEFAEAATPAPGLPFHAVIPCLRGPFGAFSAFSAFFLSTTAEQFPPKKGTGFSPSIIFFTSNAALLNAAKVMSSSQVSKAAEAELRAKRNRRG